MKKIVAIAMLCCLSLLGACAMQKQDTSDSINSESGVENSVEDSSSSSGNFITSEGAGDGGFLGGFTSISGEEDDNLDMPSLEN